MHALYFIFSLNLVVYTHGCQALHGCCVGYAVDPIEWRCLACPASKYSAPWYYDSISEDEYWYHYYKPCDDCPIGSGHQLTGQGSIDSCICNQGYGKTEPGVPCTACSPGTYKATVESIGCTNCDVGKYYSTTGASACNTCSPVCKEFCAENKVDFGVGYTL